ncbi:MAG: tRNA (N6-isopentenyl adenosine(37)-C2)-methylthiotransferase MiaB [Nannocystaceae bacterium]|nr:tRNA (N6-isopentenyl adenosine(37)-C2)-methylthiotransferase MiaB [Nannocystaceae bacterium]
MNQADSALIAGQLAEGGYRRVTKPEDADVVLINTCAVREKAEARVWGRTSQLLRHRDNNPDLVIGITGCMAEHLKEHVGERAPYVTLVAGPDSYRNIAGLLDRARAGERVVETKLDRTEVYEGLDGHPDDDGVSGFVTIQRGCDKFCTFCVVPYTRGRERGVPPREVLRQTRALAAAGYREVVLLGQTVNSYRWPDEQAGRDVRFSDLLRAVAATDGIERVRFTSPYPVDFTPDVIAAMAEVKEICPQVHLPVQSGSNVVLERMRRGYTREQFVTLVDQLRSAIPDLALSTDILVGFCGETEEDHAQTLALVDEIRFDSAFMFAYSDRGITYAGKKLDDDISPETKKRRLQEVIARQEVHTTAAHDARVSTTQRVLVCATAKRGDAMLAKTPQFQNALLPLGCAEPGVFLDVMITRSTGHSLFATPTAQQTP